MNIDNEILTEPSLLVKKSVDYFASVSNTTLHQNEDYKTRRDITHQHNQHQYPYNDKFTIAELNSTIPELKPSTPSYDEIHNLPSQAKYALLHMFITILLTGKYPDAWREAIIVPIAKSVEKKTEIINNKPVFYSSNKLPF